MNVKRRKNLERNRKEKAVEQPCIEGVSLCKE